MDLTSIFTNVPTDLVLLYNSHNFHIIYTNIPKHEFLSMVSFSFNSSVFSFTGNTCRQVFFCAMGSPLSPIIADIAMFVLEKNVLSALCYDVSLL